MWTHFYHQLKLIFKKRNMQCWGVSNRPTTKWTDFIVLSKKKLLYYYICTSRDRLFSTESITYVKNKVVINNRVLTFYFSLYQAVEVAFWRTLNVWWGAFGFLAIMKFCNHPCKHFVVVVVVVYCCQFCVQIQKTTKFSRYYYLLFGKVFCFPVFWALFYLFFLFCY